MKFLTIMVTAGVVIFGLCAGVSSTVSAATVDHSNAGYIDGVSLNPDRMSYTVSGWACAKNYTGSIDVDLYFGGPYGTGFPYGRFQASQSSEQGVAAACQSTGAAYRFNILVNNSTAKAQAGKTIFIHGINPWNGQDGVMNTVIGNSGNVSLPTLPVVQHDIRGYIDVVSKQTDGSALVSGWACVSAYDASIQVDLYAGGPFGTGTSMGRFSASIASEAGIAAACSASGSNYRFSIPVSAYDAIKYAGKSVWMHGINPFDSSGASNLVIPNSGYLRFPEINLIRDPLADAGVSPYITTLPAAETALCKSNWAAAGKLTSGAPWGFVEIAERTYFCNNPANAAPKVPGQPLVYRSADASKVIAMNPGGNAIDQERSIDFTIDTSQEWRQGCNLSLLDSSGNKPQYGGGAWNWPHLLMLQDIQNPEVPTAPLDMTRFGTMTLGASIKLASSEKAPSTYNDAQGNCPSDTWGAGSYFSNHEIFYLNVVLRNKSDNSQIYVLVPTFYSEDGSKAIPRTVGWIGNDPLAKDATYFAPGLPVLQLGQWVDFSVDLQDIAANAITAYNGKFGTSYTKSNFTLASFFMGYEVWGSYKAKVQVKNLSLKVR
ncbi:hypothetical protein ACO0LG_26070 [Undibacterium sp. Ji42W]|uniref:hypothetical protein n=1 Tax=Undibacterium sp. Ji42W TaxID=3413039 RepID=UPI003BF2B232